MKKIFKNLIKYQTALKILTKYKIKYRRFSNWFNYVSVDEHHKVHCDKTCYTLLFMGKRRQDVTLKVGEKYYDYKKGIKEYK